MYRRDSDALATFRFNTCALPLWSRRSPRPLHIRLWLDSPPLEERPYECWIEPDGLGEVRDCGVELTLGVTGGSPIVELFCIARIKTDGIGVVLTYLQNPLAYQADPIILEAQLPAVGKLP
jgi:hypothetical protein